MTEGQFFWDWDTLLDLIAARSVVPVIGSDLLLIERDGAKVLLENYLAARVAQRLNIAVGISHP